MIKRKRSHLVIWIMKINLKVKKILSLSMIRVG
jgi:hypothetical protein